MNAKIYFGSADSAIFVVVASATIKGFAHIVSASVRGATEREKSTNKADGDVGSDRN